MTQLLDVGDFGPFKSMYYIECKTTSRDIREIIFQESNSRVDLKAVHRSCFCRESFICIPSDWYNRYQQQVITDVHVAPANFCNEKTDTKNVKETEEQQNQGPTLRKSPTYLQLKLPIKDVKLMIDLTPKHFEI